MRFTCEKSMLVQGLNIAGRTVAQKSSLSVIEGILCKAGMGLSLTGYNMETAITYEIEAEVADPGQCILPAKLFGDIIRKLPNDTITIEFDDGKVMIRCAGSEFNIIGLPADEFPAINMPKDTNDLILFDKDVLKEMIRKTSFAASIDESRGVITGVLIEMQEKSLNMVALDGFRMAIAREAMINRERENIVIPAKILQEISKIISEAELVIFALYPHVFVEWIEQNQKFLKSGVLITDVTGVKRNIVYQIQNMLRPDVEFVAAHPMAGKEVYGIENSDERIFYGANYVVVPTPLNTQEGIEACKRIGEILGFGRISEISPEGHDEMIGFVSQLTHCIAVSLMNCYDGEKLQDYTGDSFRDLTRIASSSPIMWQNICLSNQTQLLKLIDAYIDTLKKTRNDIATGNSDALLSDFQEAKDYRDSFHIKKRGVMDEVFEIYLDLIDEAGGIATVATILASNHLSIKNIGIIHNREFEDGVLRLEMYDQASLDAGKELLSKYHYTIYER